MAGKKRSKKRCGAKTKTTGAPCRAPVVAGYERCKIHGGKSPRGKKSASYKHGLYSMRNELSRVHREIYEQVRSGKLDELEAAAEVFAYASGKLVELAGSAGKASLKTKQGIDAQKVLLAAQTEVRQALKLRVEARSVIDEAPAQVNIPFRFVFAEARPEDATEAAGGAEVDEEVDAL